MNIRLAAVPLAAALLAASLAPPPAHADEEVAKLKARIKELEDRITRLETPAKLGPSSAKTSSSIKDCGIKAFDFKGGAFDETTLNGFTVFVSRLKSNGNFAQICLNGAHRQVISVSGLLTRIDAAGADLVVESATPETFVDPALLTGGVKVVAGEIVSGKDRFRASALRAFVVPKTSLDAKAFDKVADHGVASIDKVARARLDLYLINPSVVRKLSVYLREASSPKKGAELVKAAVKEFLPGLPAAGEPSLTRIGNFTADEIKKEGAAAPLSDAELTVVAYTSAELSTTYKGADTSDNYKEVVPYVFLSKALSHAEKLIYCGVTGDLETLTQHVAKGHIPR